MVVGMEFIASILVQAEVLRVSSRGEVIDTGEVYKPKH